MELQLPRTFSFDSFEVQAQSTEMSSTGSSWRSSRSATALYAAFIIFGLGSWMSINAVFVESSFMVNELPEGWSLTTWIVLALQAANLAVLLVMQPLLRKFEPMHAASSMMLLLFAISSLSLMAAGFYRTTESIWGTDHSVGLLLLTFLGGLASCGSSLVFYPLAASFPRRYTTALAIGEGLSGSVAGLIGILQSHAKGGSLLFSTSTYFLVIAFICCTSVAALSFIAYHPWAALHRQFTCSTENGHAQTSIDAGSCIALDASADETGTHSGQVVVDSDLSFFQAFLQFRGCYLALLLGAALSFGIIPSVNPAACLPYPDGQNVLLWSNVMVYGFDPISRLATAFFAFKRMSVLTVIFSIAATWIFLIALDKNRFPAGMSPATGIMSSGALPVLLNMVFAAAFGYARTMAFLIIKDKNLHVELTEKLYWAAGFCVQIGGCLGSAVALTLQVLNVL
eukprot:TRINITY_DN95970_c0_g1_i1.p1 TRINITY_DN95970_c0_g1~~TRINITY_DN95970_c0_g1_i1.p1  ORF type:complete len:455 (-),score=44.26 TRINITY_DN95970_c0_g1_i1:187-1551(-)